MICSSSGDINCPKPLSGLIQYFDTLFCNYEWDMIKSPLTQGITNNRPLSSRKNPGWFWYLEYLIQGRSRYNYIHAECYWLNMFDLSLFHLWARLHKKPIWRQNGEHTAKRWVWIIQFKKGVKEISEIYLVPNGGRTNRPKTQTSVWNKW